VKTPSRSAAGLGRLSIGFRALGRKPLRETRLGLVACVLLGGLCAAICAPAALADSDITLHSFAGTNSNDGANPGASGLTFDSAGNLYGTTQQGGTSNYGTAFKLSPASGGGYTETVLYSFTGGNDGGSPVASSLIFDGAGNLYGETFSSADGAGTVFKLSPASGGGYTETVLYNFTGGSDGEDPYGGLILDSAGNLYGTTVLGGTSGYGTVFELSPASGGGYTETVLHSFTGGSDGLYPYGILIFDSTGNLYGTTIQGGPAGDGTVFELSPTSGGGYTEAVLYSFTGGSDGAVSTAGLILDSAGNLYGTTGNGGTSGYGTVFELSPAAGGGYTETVLYSFTGRSDPYAGLIFDSAGNLYGTTIQGGTDNIGTVFKLSPASGGGYTETVLHSFTYGSDGAYPYAGLIFDSAGNLYGTAQQGGPSGVGTAFEIVTGITVPAKYSFGNVATRNTSAVAKLTVKVGSAAVSFSNTSLSGANSADFSISANTCTGTIAATKSCTLSVTFTPSAAAGTVESATLALTDSASSSAQTIALSGTSTAPVTVSPASINFDAVAVGSTSAHHTITIANHQSSAAGLSVTFASVNDFAFNGGTCSSSLKAFGSCTVILTFTPSAAVGTVESATLAIDSASSSPQAVALAGTSSAPVTFTTSVAFGTVAVGSTSANHTITITNHQSSAISLGTAISGADPSDFAFNGGTCSGSLKAFGSCTVILDFSPGATGSRSATLNLTDSPDTSSPHAIKLTGSGK
jgi:uncharacterized repeat protein (TIGR03803 family)